MNLDEAQRKKVAEWVANGLKLSEIQNRMASELGIRMTYMEVRLLADDLKLTPKDVEMPGPAVANVTNSIPKTAGETRLASTPDAPAKDMRTGADAVTGEVSVQADQIARPGAVVSGKVSFSDGVKAEWYFDQTGRLGLIPQQAGYRPAPEDLQQFQIKLEALLSRMGL